MGLETVTSPTLSPGLALAVRIETHADFTRFLPPAGSSG